MTAPTTTDTTTETRACCVCHHEKPAAGGLESSWTEGADPTARTGWTCADCLDWYTPPTPPNLDGTHDDRPRAYICPTCHRETPVAGGLAEPEARTCGDCLIAADLSDDDALTPCPCETDAGDLIRFACKHNVTVTCNLCKTIYDGSDPALRIEYGLAPLDMKCPHCGEGDLDNLVWSEDDLITCQTCNTVYDPAGVPAPHETGELIEVPVFPGPDGLQLYDVDTPEGAAAAHRADLMTVSDPLEY